MFRALKEFLFEWVKQEENIPLLFNWSYSEANGSQEMKPYQDQFLLIKINWFVNGKLIEDDSNISAIRLLTEVTGQHISSNNEPYQRLFQLAGGQWNHQIGSHVVCV